MAIYFEEEYAHNKSSSFVPVDKRMVADYSHHVGTRHVYGVRSVTVRMESLRTSKSGQKKARVPNVGYTAIERQKAIVEREGITFINPDELSHLASEWRVLR